MLSDSQNPGICEGVKVRKPCYTSQGMSRASVFPSRGSSYVFKGVRWSALTGFGRSPQVFNDLKVATAVVQLTCWLSGCLAAQKVHLRLRILLVGSEAY